MGRVKLTEEQKLILFPFFDSLGKLRLAKNIGVEELAMISGVSKSRAYEFLRGEDGITLLNFAKLLKGLDYELFDLGLIDCPYDNETMHRLVDEACAIREKEKVNIIPPRERASKKK